MISTYDYWLSDIGRFAISLESRYRQKRWNPSSFHRLEREIFLGFFAIRKLIEAKKINKAITGNQIKVVSYRRLKTGEEFDPGDFLPHYGPGDGRKTVLSLEDLCNEFIHSFIFSPFIPFGKELVGFYFCSDKSSKERVYYLRLADIACVFQSVAKNRIVKVKIEITKPDFRLTVPSIRQ